MTSHWIRAEYDADTDTLSVTAMASAPYGPEGQERDATIAVPVSFDPATPCPQAKLPANTEPEKARRIAAAVCPSQVDLPPELAEDLKGRLKAMAELAAAKLKPHARRAAAVANLEAEKRGEFDDAT